MNEYIVTCDEETASWIGNDVDSMKRLVRCRDCYFGKKVHWPTNSKTPSDWLDCVGPMVETWDYWNDEPKDNPVPPNGFCAWGERADNFATCKCGEDIETNGRESVTCPSCGRVVTE